MFSTVIRVLTEVGVGIFTKAVARENWQPPCCNCLGWLHQIAHCQLLETPLCGRVLL